MMKSSSSSLKVQLFLLYVGVMLIITFLQQEFVLMPELRNFDLVGDEARAQMLEGWQKWRWISFVAAPLLLLLRLSLVSLCLFVGSFFFAQMAGLKFKDWWTVAMRAQAVMLLYSVVLCAVNIAAGTDKAQTITNCTSLLFLGGDNMEQWMKLPLSAVNVFEIAYWFVMARLVSVRTENKFGKSFAFVMSSYGVGYLFYIVLLMFLMLYPS